MGMVGPMVMVAAMCFVRPKAGVGRTCGRAASVGVIMLVARIIVSVPMLMFAAMFGVSSDIVIGRTWRDAMFAGHGLAPRVIASLNRL